MKTVRVGTCGWSYGDWVGPFYPPGTAAGDYLAHYAGQFDIVEVDSTFYRAPSARTTGRWARQTPDSFRFTLKMPQTITHEKALLDCDRELDEFLANIAPLGEKLHSVLLQFGYFNKQAFASAGAPEPDSPGLGTPDELVAFINNHYAGHAPALCRAFLAELHDAGLLDQPR